jgi:hypothetical protein
MSEIKHFTLDIDVLKELKQYSEANPLTERFMNEMVFNGWTPRGDYPQYLRDLSTGLSIVYTIDQFPQATMRHITFEPLPDVIVATAIMQVMGFKTGVKNFGDTGAPDFNGRNITSTPYGVSILEPYEEPVPIVTQMFDHFKPAT